MDTWKSRIIEMQLPGGTNVKDVIMPIFNVWIKKDFISLSHEVTQTITGHGSFGYYLWKFKRRRSAKCIYCNNEREDNLHVLMNCPEWEEQRMRLIDRLRISEINLATVINAAIQDEDKWKALREFCKDIMSYKIKNE